jgi:hypothetical protein
MGFSSILRGFKPPQNVLREFSELPFNSFPQIICGSFG